MRTDFLDPNNVKVTAMPNAYKGTMADLVMQGIFASHGQQRLDPSKAADAIVKEVLEPSADPPLLRMPLGEDTLGWMKSRSQEYLETVNAFGKVALAASFEP
jgi:hypothetical protein